MVRKTSEEIADIKAKYANEIDDICSEIDDCPNEKEYENLLKSQWEIDGQRFNILDIMILSGRAVEQQLINAFCIIGITSDFVNDQQFQESELFVTQNPQPQNVARKTLGQIIDCGGDLKVMLPTIKIGIVNNLIPVDEEALKAAIEFRDRVCVRNDDGVMKNRRYLGAFEEVVNLLRVKLDAINKSQQTTGDAAVFMVKQMSNRGLQNNKN